MHRSISIDDRLIGSDRPCFVVAEAGVNHNGDLNLALQLVDAASAAGADAVKFQTFSADTLVSPCAPQFPYARTVHPALSQYEMLRRLELPREMHAPIQARCKERGVMFLSTPFHESDVDWLDDFGVPAFKIGSGEITNLPLLVHVARKRKPIILSTGMASLAEVARAVEVITEASNEQLALLHCVSAYPAPPSDVNLRAMKTLRDAFGMPTGFSDHTEGGTVALAAVALGAAIVEKHLTLDRALPGPDHSASIEPEAFADLVASIRVIESSLGSGIKRGIPAELEIAVCVRKSLVAARDLAAGERLAPEMLEARRPGSGLPPDSLPFLIGRGLTRDVRAGRPLALDDLI